MIQFIAERVLPFSLTLAIQVFAVSSMLMVGLRYSIGDLTRPLRDIPGVLIALVTNFVLVPALAVLLLWAFPLEAPYATGLMIVASAGSRGTTSPLQRGQWLPQPAPEPVARTYAPQRITPRL